MTLHQPSSKTERIVALQILRFLAASLVILVHGIDSTIAVGTNLPVIGRGNLENFGAIGVDIFFVISGFIIVYASFGSHPIDAKEFLARRIMRIFPIYYLLSIPVVIYRGLDGSFGAEKILPTLTLWPALPSGIVIPFLSIGWTLCFEMLFYYFVFLIKLKNKNILVLVFYFILLVSSQIETNSLILFMGNPIILEFLAGAILAIFYNRIRYLPPWVLFLGLGLLVFFIGLLVWRGFGNISEVDYTLDASLSLQRVALFGGPAVLLVLVFLGFETYLRNFQNGAIRLMILLGDASYSTYLAHTTILKAFNTAYLKWGWQIEGHVWLLLIFTSASVGGVVSYLCIEKPLLKQTRRAWVKSKQRAARRLVSVGD